MPQPTMPASRLLVLLPAVLALAACPSLDKSYPERRQFVLDTGVAATAPDTLPDATEPRTVLAVRRFSVSDAFDTSEFAYRTGDAEWETDYYNGFLVPPALQLADEARKTLAAAGHFTHVVDTASHLHPTHLLEGHLTSLYADFRDRDEPRAVVRLQLFLLDLRGRDPRVILQHDYATDAVFDPGDYNDETLGEAIMTGWNDALADVFADFTRRTSRLDLTPQDAN